MQRMKTRNFIPAALVVILIGGLIAVIVTSRPGAIPGVQPAIDVKHSVGEPVPATTPGPDPPVATAGAVVVSSNDSPANAASVEPNLRSKNTGGAGAASKKEKI